MHAVLQTVWLNTGSGDSAQNGFLSELRVLLLLWWLEVCSTSGCFQLFLLYLLCMTGAYGPVEPLFDFSAWFNFHLAFYVFMSNWFPLLFDAV